MTPSVPAGSNALSAQDFLEAVRERVNARLAAYLDGATAHARASAAEAVPILEQIHEFTMRGGKRLRPALVVAAARSVSAQEDFPAGLTDVCAAIELLQTYLLVHDDWMDGDELRRGGPTVHVALARRFGSPHLGAATAILAGDLACTLAQDLVCAADLPAERTRAVMRAFVGLQHAVILGQTLDVVGAADLEAMYDLKTGSYTVRGPLALGHAAQGGGADTWAALEAYARPLGVAFQLRDDLLGLFGDAATTGKGARADFCAGKRTAPILAALERLDAAGRDELRELLAAPTEAALPRARALIERSGAVDALGARIATLRAEGLRALETPAVDPAGRALLVDLARLATDRGG